MALAEKFFHKCCEGRGVMEVEKGLRSFYISEYSFNCVINACPFFRMTFSKRGIITNAVLKGKIKIKLNKPLFFSRIGAFIVTGMYFI